MKEQHDPRPSLAALSAAKRLLFERRLQGTSAGHAGNGLTHRPGTTPPALSPGQQRLWFLHQLAPESPAYTMYQAVRLEGPLDEGVLERSLNEVVRRHEVLRTTFETVDGQAVPVVTPARRLALPVVDLRALPEPERTARAGERATAEVLRPFDLATGPLVRTLLLRLAAADHVLLVTMHHIVSDEWSLDVFWRETAALYGAYRAGRPSPLDELPLQYADYAHWQRKRVEDGELAQQLAYWKRQLGGDLPVLQLPTDRPPPAQPSFEGDMAARVLPAALGTALRQRCRSEGVTLFVLMLAAFQTLLYRYAGQTDLVVGVPVTNRGRAELEGLIGFFINTLALRADLSGDPTFLDVLQRTRKAALEGFAHQELPFERLVEELHPERQAGRNPLFQVMFVLQQEPALPPWDPELHPRPFPLQAGAAKLDLTLFVTDGHPHLTLSFEYNTALFDRDTVTRMLGHLEALLEGIAADPGQRIGTLPLLTETERQQLLAAWSTTGPAEPAEACIHHLIAAQAERTPEADAVVFEDRRLSYRELERRAERLAHVLRQHGVGPGVCAGLCVERSPEMLVGILGILKAGGAYVPLDPAYPAERLRFMLADSGAPVLLVQQTPDWLPPGAGTRILRVDAPGPDPATPPPRARTVTLDDPAYVIYTSGSTGVPKGVPVTHRNLVHSTLARLRFYPEPVGRFLLLSSFAFDSSVAGLFWTFCTGGTLVLPRQRQEQDVAALATLVARHGVTHTLCLPSLYGLILAYADPRELTALQTVIVAGEACPPAVARRHHALLPHTALYNEYGPTEATVWSTVYRVPPQEPDASVPIGRPIAGCEIYLLDAHLQPVPVGVPGELFIGGAGLVRGYLNRPALTTERFLPHPFRSDPEARLYRTGDRARYRPDGTLVFLGRIDDQVKIRGYRIEPGEIEAALRRHPAVHDAAVAARDAPARPEAPDTNGADRLLAAYVVPREGQAAPAPAELRRFLKERLPDHLVPSAFVLLDALPRAPGGKVDARALPAPTPVSEEREASYVAPRTPAEQVLAGIWAEVLGVDRIGIRDNFFEAGGDSIVSIQIIAKARQAGLHLTPGQLFQHQTVAELAAVAGTAQPVRVAQEAVTGPVPLTPIQHWFFEQPLAVPHHWHHVLWLDEPADDGGAAFETALQVVVRHHDALRLRFVQEAGGWRSFHAAPDTPVSVEHVDLSPVPEHEQTAAMEATAAALFDRLDLAEGPMVQAARFTPGNGRPARLLLGIHHLVVDLVSWRILVEDLGAACAQHLRGEAITLPPRTTSFKAWSEALQAHAASDRLQAERPYWLAQSGDGRLPVDFDGVFTEASAAVHTATLDAEETRALLQDVPAAYPVQVEEVLLAALVQAFAPWTGTPELLVGLERHGREVIAESLDLSRTVGWFTAFFPVLLRAEASAAPGDTLRSVKEQLRRIPGGGVGYGLLRYLGPDAALRQQLRDRPRPAVLFNYAGRAGAPGADSGIFRSSRVLGVSRSPLNRRGHLLEINAFVEDDRLRLEWTFSTNVHRPVTIERLAGRHLALLRRLTAHGLSATPDGYTPSDFPEAGLSQAELDRFMDRLFS